MQGYHFSRAPGARGRADVMNERSILILSKSFADGSATNSRCRSRDRVGQLAHPGHHPGHHPSLGAEAPRSAAEMLQRKQSATHARSPSARALRAMQQLLQKILF